MQRARRRAAAAWRSTSPTATPRSTRSRRAHEHFGRLDIVVNNAGYGQFGLVEELSEQEARDQIETNLFGALWVTQAALPFLREQGSGHILQVSSIGGISAFPGIGMYHASKWALEGFSQALAQEVKGFGIHVTLIEPGGFSTDWGGVVGAPRAAARRLRARRTRRRGSGARAARARPAIRPPPPRPSCASSTPTSRRCACSSARAPLGIAEQDYEGRLATWREWQPVAEIAQGQNS